MVNQPESFSDSKTNDPTLGAAGAGSTPPGLSYSHLFALGEGEAPGDVIE